MKHNAILFVIWAIASALAIAFATLPLDSVLVNGEYLPFANDSFYHARRILDAAIGERGFYQFDTSMHVPEGSWVSWSWGYDFLLAMALKIGLLISPGMDPMKFLVYVPVAWVVVNTGLVVAVGRTLRLSNVNLAMIALGFALLPLTQKLHGVGRIDHHFIELTFVLLLTLLSLRWVQQPSRQRAVACGLALGIAPMFHHALFVLQLPVLVSLSVLWMRNLAPSPQQLRVAALALVLATAAILLPSGPFRDGQFSLATLSWFHAWVALATGGVMCFLAWRPYHLRQLGWLAALSALLAVPLLGEVLLGARFLSGGLFQSTAILEITSPLEMLLGNWGFGSTIGLYSGLLLLAPVVLLLLAWRSAVSREASELTYGVFAVFGLSLLLLQFRLNYFGIAFLLTGPFFLLAKVQQARGWPARFVAVGALIVLVLSFRPALSSGLLERYPAGGDHLYATVRPLLDSLHAECEKEPLTVITANQFGHYVRFHTDCSVIANNFLITPQHFSKVEQVNSLFHLSPQALRSKIGQPVYLLAYLGNAFEMRGGRVVMRDMRTIRERNPALLADLFFEPVVPAGYTLINEVLLDAEVSPRPVLARLYRVEPIQKN